MIILLFLHITIFNKLFILINKIIYIIKPMLNTLTSKIIFIYYKTKIYLLKKYDS